MLELHEKDKENISLLLKLRSYENGDKNQPTFIHM